MRQLLISLFLVLAWPVEACPLCRQGEALPLLDRIEQAEWIVIAQKDELVGRLDVETLLKSQYPDEKPPALDLLLPYPVQLKLERNKQTQLLCFFEKRDGGKFWTFVETVEPAFEEFIVEAIDRVDSLQASVEKRKIFFVNKARSKNPKVRRAALEGLGTLPYEEIRSLPDVLTLDRLRGLIEANKPQKALAILLLAQKAEEADVKMYRSKVLEEGSLDPNLSAWIAGWIECERAEAIAAIKDNYFTSATSPERHEALLSALSVQGRAEPERSSDFLPLYREILQSSPKLAPRAVIDLTEWEKWDLTSEIYHILETQSNDFTRTELLQLRDYLNQAPKSSVKDEPAEAKLPIIWVLLLLIVPAYLAIRRFFR